MKVWKKIGKIIDSKYKLLLATSIILLFIATFFTSKLKLEFNWISLLPKNDISTKEFIAIEKNFASSSTIILVIQGKNKDTLKKLAKNLSQDIKNLGKKWIINVKYKLNTDFFLKNLFLLTEISDLKRFERIYFKNNIVDFFSALNDDFEREYIGEENKTIDEQEKDIARALEGIGEFIKEITEYLQGKEINFKTAIIHLLLGKQYFLSYKNDTIIMMIYPKPSYFDTEKSIMVIEKIEKLLDKYRKIYKDYKFGQTGLYVLNRDEYETALYDTKINLIFATIFVLLLFIISFRLILSPIYSLISLLTGIIWALGIIYLIYGRLNIMTAMTSVILIGLGIDYSIHILSAYSHHPNKNFKSIYQDIGRGLFIGATTTAIVFFSFIILPFQAIKEFGIVMGIGIISTLLSTMIILPSLLHLFPQKKDITPIISYKFLEKISNFTYKKYPFIIILFVLLTIIGIYYSKQVEVSTDFEEIEAKGLTSIKLMKILEKKYDTSSDPILIRTHNLQTAYTLTQKFKKLPIIGLVESISEVLPPKEKQIKRLKYISSSLKNNFFLAFNKTNIPNINRKQLLQEIKRLGYNIQELSDMAYINGLNKITKRADFLIKIEKKKLLPNYPITNLYKAILNAPSERIKKLNDNFIHYLKETLKIPLNKQTPITKEELPSDLKISYISFNGKEYLISVYGNKNIWKNLMKTNLIKKVLSISHKATGNPVFLYKFMKFIISSGKQAAILAIILVAMTVFLSIRKISYSVITLFPLFIGSVLTFGFMGYMDIKLTYITILVIPMLIGIGIDDGAHIISSYLIHKEHINSTIHRIGRAILLTTLTTAIAFGSLYFSKFEGYKQFGLALFFGISIMFIITITLIPSAIAILDFYSKRTPRK